MISARCVPMATASSASTSRTAATRHTSPGDDTPAERNRYAFLCQLMNTSEGFHISYVNKDLKKDADIYPSSVVRDLVRFIGDERLMKSISLDENRAWGELFTPKSRRNKRNHRKLRSGAEGKESGNGNEVQQNGEMGKVKPPEYVSTYDLAKFLKDPFVFGADRNFAEGEEKNEEQKEFEPLCLSHLEQSAVLKKMVLAKFDETAQKETDKTLKKLASEGRLDENTVFGKKQKEALEARAEEYHEKLSGIISGWRAQHTETEDWHEQYNRKFQDLRIDEAGKAPWYLTGSLDICDAEKPEEVSNFVEIHSGKTSEGVKLRTHVKALAILAAHAGADIVTVSGTDIFSDAEEPLTRRWRCAPAEARNNLQEIYNAAFGNAPYRKEVDIDLPEKLKNKNETPPTFRDYKDKLLGDNGIWEHFGKKKLFNTLDDVGFTSEEFKTLWPTEQDTMRPLRHFAEILDEQQSDDAAVQSSGSEG